MNNDIVIQKLNIDIYLDEHPAPQQFLDKSVAEIKAIVLPLVEQELAKLGYTDEDIVCERIELNLQNSRQEGWQVDLGVQISKNIQEAVAQERLIKTTEQLLEAKESNASEKHPEKSSTSSKKKNTGQGFVPDAALLAPMMHFFIYGLLPKTIKPAIANYKALEARLLAAENKEELIATLLQELAHQPHLRKRFLNQASVSFRKAVLERTAAPDVIQFIEAASADASPYKAFRKKLWEALFTAPESKKKFLAVWMLHFAKKATVQVHAEVKQLATKMTSDTANKKPIRHQILALEEVMATIKPAKQEEEKAPTPVKNTIEEEGIEINNAGIVLLCQFLPTLFQNLKLINAQNKWASEQHQVEAIYLLHYLSTGSFEATEDELFLAKLITAFPLEEVLPVLEEPPVFEKLEEELEGLLVVIQENWKPMRNCTWEGLQRDFLNRAGTLQQTDDNHYLLTPENHGLDVLLPFISWGISMVKYSWMEGVVIVEWE